MTRFLRKNEEGQEIRSYDFDSEMKIVNDYEIIMIGSTESIDRDNEVLKMDGWDLNDFKKNNVVLAGHNYSMPAIANATVKKQDGKLKFKITFPTEEQGAWELSEIYRKLYKSGFMKASSVGFMPISWENGDGEKTPNRTFIKQKLLELSLVTVPCNPDALTEAKEKGILNDSDINYFNKSINENKDIEPIIKESEYKIKEIDIEEIKLNLNKIYFKIQTLNELLK